MSRVAAATDAFFAIADPTRRKLLELLANGEKSVSDLVAAFRISQPSISEHLRVLRAVGLVRIRKKGRWRLYRLNPGRLRSIATWVHTFSRFWEKRLDGLETYLNHRE